MSIFEEGNDKKQEESVDSPQSTQESNPAPQGNSYDVLLRSITREDGSQMYNSVEEALKGLANTKQHVATVESEKKQLSEQFESMKAEYEKAKAAADAIERLAPKQEQQESRPASNAIDEGTLKSMFQDFLKETETQKSREQNEAQVSEALSQKFGSKAKEQFENTAKELGIPTSELRDLAGKSPQAVLKLFGSSAPKEAGTTTSSVNTSAMQPKAPQPDAPRKSVLVGATSNELRDELIRNKRKVYQDLGIEF